MQFKRTKEMKKLPPGFLFVRTTARTEVLQGTAAEKVGFRDADGHRRAEMFLSWVQAGCQMCKLGSA